MLLGFKRRFVLFVEDGSKTHTMRAGSRFRVGMRCDCYADPRQSTMRLLGRWACIRVQDVEIDGGLGGISAIRIDGIALSLSEMRDFAWRDGFREEGDSLAQMSAFFEREHALGPSYIFKPQMIHWNRAAPMPGPKKRAR